MKRFRFGPGLLVTAAFIGPGTIVTASRAGAGYGVTLLWAVLFSVAATVILQDMAARVGLAGRRGLAEAIRDSLDNRRIRVGALGLITVTILVGNAAFQTGNLIGASLGLSLLSGLPQEALALVVGGLAAGLLLTGTYQTNPERAGLSGRADEHCVLRGRGAHRPGHRRPDRRGLDPPPAPWFAADCLGAHRHDLRLLQPVPPRQHRAGNAGPTPAATTRIFGKAAGIRCSRWSSAASSRRQSSSPPHRSSDRERTRRTHAAVAERLEPLLGRAAPVFFGLGLFAAGLTLAITAPLAAAYAAGGALGWPPDLRSGRFRLLWGFVLATGVFCAVALGGSPYYVILLAQAGNGLVLPSR